ncbi:hypothetical protein JS756_05685 [Streptomyces actuosus]|uniref:Uncharacterized protein n=1 Tax=Streptomyces actuosus TaxID=1885 RepID=A0ABS2VKH3_STRAS|nr:hypothetical protein [Streptomyces actuosus]MBN0043602.1 hypothetical protein [Streptomyces actuosus]
MYLSIFLTAVMLASGAGLRGPESASRAAAVAAGASAEESNSNVTTVQLSNLARLARNSTADGMG